MRHVDGESKPIVLTADRITHWVENDQQVLLLQGNVLVEQGVVNIGAQEAVAWVDLERYRRTKVHHLALYAEDKVLIENGPESRRFGHASIDQQQVISGSRDVRGRDGPNQACERKKRGRRLVGRPRTGTYGNAVANFTSPCARRPRRGCHSCTVLAAAQ